MLVSTLIALLPLALAAPAKRASPAPLLKPRDADLIEGKFIVKLTDGIKLSSVSDAVTEAKEKADLTYSDSFEGFAVSLSDEEVETLRDDPDVSESVQMSLNIDTHNS